MPVNDEVIEICGELDNNFIPEKDPKSIFPDNLRAMMQMPAGLQLSSLSAREWFQNRRQKLKPWLTFVSTSNFVVPTTPQGWSKRVVKNVDHFQSNYMFVFIVLFLYCILTSFLLLVAVAASLGGMYIVSLRNAEKKLMIGGHVVPLAHQYMAVSILSFPIFYLAGASSALFWVIGASFFLIMVHATFYNIEAVVGSEDQPFELQMEQV